jgi:MarR family transcriptional regulator, organic hydroperoxide resistance regulator
MTEPASDDPLLLSNQLCFAVYSTAHAFNRLYKPLLEALGLTYPQYLVMLALWERDGRMVKEIGEQLHLDSGTLTPLLKRLEAAGLVARARDTSDERQLRVTLTDQGKVLKEKAHVIPQEVACASGRSIPELIALRDDLVRLRDRLNNGGESCRP